MGVTTGAVMSDAMVRLDELADPMAFLTGARVPLTHLWPVPFRAVEWVVDRILIDAESGPRFDSIRPETVIMLGIDCANPDVARWVDRKIGALTYVSSNEWTLQIARRVCREERGGWSMKRTGIAAQFPVWNRHGRACRNTSNHDRLCRLDCPALATIPCDEAHLPTARAALLRAFFGRSDV